jgi:hypothetical protein
MLKRLGNLPLPGGSPSIIFRTVAPPHACVQAIK